MRLNPFAQARFLMSGAKPEQLPHDETPELAFAGRSNAGKSSALNALCGQTALARVSKTPGRTQLVNLFEVPGLGRLADLPGYGYAKVPREVQQDWGRLVGGYVEARMNLKVLVVIMDIRHPLTPLDEQMIGWAHGRSLPVHVLLTKADKLGFGAGKDQLTKVRKALLAAGVEAQAQLFSSTAKTGVEEAREHLAKFLAGGAAGPQK